MTIFCLLRFTGYSRGMLLMALTGYDSASDRQRSIEHGFDHHILKPVDPDRLRAFSVASLNRERCHEAARALLVRTRLECHL